MVSFYDLWERMEDSPLMDSGEDTKAMQVIRAGKNLRKEDERPFWEEFMELCGNSEGMASLLGVDSARVIGWPSKIQSMLESVDAHDDENGMDDADSKVVPTGDNDGAVTIPNADPYLGEM